MKLIPVQHYTFYDFIINKARGKSGPLFNVDVHDDVRMLADATKEKDESHAGKVVERSWYQRNKHIFPASRWEVSSMHQCILSRGGSLTYLPSRCLTRRKTMASIPSLRLYGVALVSRISPLDFGGARDQHKTLLYYLQCE